MPYFYKAEFSDLNAPAVVGRIVSQVSKDPNVSEIVLNPKSLDDCLNCSAILLTEGKDIPADKLVVYCPELSWGFGDVVRLDPHSKRVYLLYSRDSNANALFVTELCNCNCIMCPQPPKEKEYSRVDEVLQTIACLPEEIEELGITGGEPTILRDDFIRILGAIKNRNPLCKVHVLSNARLLSDIKYAQAIKNVGLQNLTFGVPIYSSDATLHDYIVQSKGAFDQTLNGIYNLAECGIPVEIRTVIHKQTYSGLKELSEFVYSTLPFAFHIAFMGMEHMGYVKKNWDLLWIHPKQYLAELFEAASYLHMRGMNVSVYNLPLCFLDKRLWVLSRKSISDYKDVFLESCCECSQLENCGGIFKSQENTYQVEPFTGFEFKK